MQDQTQAAGIPHGQLAQTMTLQEFKQRVEAHLLKISGSKDSVQQTMKLYEADFPELWKENWSVEATATGMLMGYI